MVACVHRNVEALSRDNPAYCDHAVLQCRVMMTAAEELKKRLEDEWLTVEQLRELPVFQHLSPSTLASWRSAGRGPRFIVIGRKPFYRRAEVERWLREEEERRQRRSSQVVPADRFPAVPIRRQHQLGRHKTRAEKREEALRKNGTDGACC